MFGFIFRLRLQSTCTLFMALPNSMWGPNPLNLILYDASAFKKAIFAHSSTFVSRNVASMFKHNWRMHEKTPSLLSKCDGARKKYGLPHALLYVSEYLYPQMVDLFRTTQVVWYRNNDYYDQYAFTAIRTPIHNLNHHLLTYMSFNAFWKEYELPSINKQRYQDNMAPF